MSLLRKKEEELKSTEQNKYEPQLFVKGDLHIFVNFDETTDSHCIVGYYNIARNKIKDALTGEILATDPYSILHIQSPSGTTYSKLFKSHLKKDAGELELTDSTHPKSNKPASKITVHKVGAYHCVYDYYTESSKLISLDEIKYLVETINSCINNSIQIKKAEEQLKEKEQLAMQKAREGYNFNF